MKLLCIGDVVSDTGVRMLSKHLKRLKQQTKANFVIVNGENAAVGNGIDRLSCTQIFDAGADIITGGNHSFQKKNAAHVLEEMPRLLRPENLGNTFGRGWVRLDGTRRDLLVLNLQGQLFLPEIENPFTALERFLNEVATPRDIIVVDFHAEATGEKQALGYFADGKISLLFGTHTHVQTNDEHILPGGTGYITDLGMTGPIYSVLGKAVDPAIHNFYHQNDGTPRRPVQDAPEPCRICGITADIDETTGKCVDINKITIE